MKNAIKFVAIIAAGSILALTACRKAPKDVSQTVKVQYPVIKLKGAEYNTIGIGGSFTDPGATMFDTFTGTTTDISPTQSAVDNTTPGMYPIIYEGTNKYGFKSQAVRWVAVTSISASENIGGTYKRTSNGQPISVTKVATGIYAVDNMGGVPGNADYLYNTYFVQLTDTTLHFPEQPGPFGSVTAKSETILKTSSDTLIAWIVLGPGFGTALRKFSHQ